MNVEEIKYLNVALDGKIGKSNNTIRVNGGIIISHSEGGCGVHGCHCSDGFCVAVLKPRTPDGIVEGLKIRFKDRKEMSLWIISNVCQLGLLIGQN